MLLSISVPPLLQILEADERRRESFCDICIALAPPANQLQSVKCLEELCRVEWPVSAASIARRTLRCLEENNSV